MAEVLVHMRPFGIAQHLVPAEAGVVIVGAGVDHRVIGVVEDEVRVVGSARIGELQDLHAGQPLLVTQCTDLVGDHAQVLGHQRQIAQRFVRQENLRHEQHKLVKYKHLVANLVILHNVNAMTKVLKREGYDLRPDLLAGLSPYRNRHINLLGTYQLQTNFGFLRNQQLAPIDTQSRHPPLTL